MQTHTHTSQLQDPPKIRGQLRPPHLQHAWNWPTHYDYIDLIKPSLWSIQVWVKRKRLKMQKLQIFLLLLLQKEGILHQNRGNNFNTIGIMQCPQIRALHIIYHLIQSNLFMFFFMNIWCLDTEPETRDQLFSVHVYVQTRCDTDKELFDVVRYCTVVYYKQ